MAKRRPGTPAQQARDRAVYERRRQRAEAAGFRGYSGAGGQRQARSNTPPRVLPNGVDVSRAGTTVDGNNTRTLLAVVRRAAAVKGPGWGCVLRVEVTDLVYDGRGKGPARHGGYGVVTETEDEVTISIPDESGYRDNMGRWIAEGFALGDILQAVDNADGNVRDALADLVLATVGVEDVGHVIGFHLVIPGYRGA